MFSFGYFYKLICISFFFFHLLSNKYLAIKRLNYYTS